MKPSKRLMLSLLIGALPLLGSQCDSGVLFKEIASTDLADPIALAVDAAKLRAYVVNSNNSLEFTTTHLTVLDLTDPAAPVILNNAANPIPMPNFSAQIHYDPASGLAYIANRESEGTLDTVDTLLRINVDDASAGFGTADTFASGDNPFGVACCDAQGRLYVVAAGSSNGPGTLNVYNPLDLSSFVQISLAISLSSGESFQGRDSTEAVLLGNQLFVSNRQGRIYVINTDEVGDTSKNPIDTIILSDDDRDFRGVATDGTSIFVVDGKNKDTLLWVLNPSGVPPVSPDTTTINELNITALQTTTVALGKDPNEIVTFKGKAYVTNREDDTVSVIDLATNSLTTTITVGNEPYGMAAFAVGATDYLYVANLTDDSISIVDLATNAVISTFQP